jgi:hypothetical protein
LPVSARVSRIKILAFALWSASALSHASNFADRMRVNTIRGMYPIGYKVKEFLADVCLWRALSHFPHAVRRCFCQGAVAT